MREPEINNWWATTRTVELTPDPRRCNSCHTQISPDPLTVSKTKHVLLLRRQFQSMQWLELICWNCCAWWFIFANDISILKLVSFDWSDEIQRHVFKSSSNIISCYINICFTTHCFDWVVCSWLHMSNRLSSLGSETIPVNSQGAQATHSTSSYAIAKKCDTIDLTRLKTF